LCFRCIDYESGYCQDGTDLILKSAHEFHPQRAFGGALLLLVLDGLLALERFFGRLIGASDTSAH
jgi:hypothetical protein